MPRVIACSDSATITMQAHLHEGDRGEKKTAFLVQFFSLRTCRPFLQFMQFSAQIIFFSCINLTRSKSFTFHSLQSHESVSYDRRNKRPHLFISHFSYV